MATKGNTPKLLGIPQIAAQLGLSDQRVRTAIRHGELETTMVPVNEGSKTMKHVATPEQIKAWREKVGGNRTTREDGRNRYILYATQDELAAHKALNAGIVEKPVYGKSKKAKAAEPKAS